MSERLNVVVCAPIMGRDLSPIRSIDPSINVIDGNEIFAAYNEARQARDAAAIESTGRQMQNLLRQADVLCMMYPMLENAAALAPNLRWLHHTQAGVSNLWSSDVWTAETVLITSGRGHVRPTAIAEYCIAAVLNDARALHQAYADKRDGRLDRSHYRPTRAAGATMGIIGLGGIGGEVARLAKGLGMHVIATRRSVTAPVENYGYADVLLPAAALERLARESDFVAVCTALTAETRHLLDRRFFSALVKQPLIINISRGEVIDEAAMLAAIEAGQIRGAVLDVYEGELERQPPRPELFSTPSILLTPHISGFGDVRDSSFMDLFCENLRRYVIGEPLLNLVDRRRGY